MRAGAGGGNGVAAGGDDSGVDHEAVIAIVLGTAVTLLGGGLAWVLRSVVANAKEVALLRAAQEY